MIDERSIEEAAGKIMSKQFYSFFENIKDYRSQSKKDFKAGIDWFLNNLWHDANEEPEKDKVLLIKYHQLGVRDPRYLVLNEGANGDWSDTVADYHIYSWLYIEDLMKGGE